jgi:hypothetical protein
MRILLAIGLFCCVTGVSTAQWAPGKVLEEKTVQSTILMAFDHPDLFAAAAPLSICGHTGEPE